MKLKDWLDINRNSFSDSDLRFLLKEKKLGKNFALLERDYLLEQDALEELNSISSRYRKGIPMAYLLGKEEFLARKFNVNSSVLIPRKETELIVEKTIDIIAKNDFKNVLDLCCGCGCIAISILKGIKHKISVFASDLSFEALRVARSNCLIHEADVKLVNADLLESFRAKTFDIIVSNPPYVESSYLEGDFLPEPKIALWAGDDGMVFIDKILKKSFFLLSDNGYLILEIGYKHKDLVEKSLNNINLYEKVEWIRDYSGHFRGIVLKKI